MIINSIDTYFTKFINNKISYTTLLMKNILLTFVLVFISTYSQCQTTKELPVFQGKDLKIDIKRLRPFRLQYWPKSDRLDSLFRNAQISHTIERGDYYDDGELKSGIRIRWVSNTHGFEDMAYVDASTFGIVTNTATLNIQKAPFVHSYFGKNKVFRTILRNDSIPKTSSITLKYNDYYHLIVMPYLFASSDLGAGAKFQLPFYSGVSNAEKLIKVNIIGSSEYIDRYGQTKNAWRVDTDHGYARLNGV